MIDFCTTYARTAVKASLVLALLAAAGPSGRVAAQEADVRQAVAQTMSAWGSGDFQAFANFYHPEARGFFLDGGGLVRGFDMNALEAAHASGFRADLKITELDVYLAGETAVAAGYLEGSLTLPGGINLPGRWRYTETRVLHEGAWKILQYHLSTQGLPQTPGS